MKATGIDAGYGLAFAKSQAAAGAALPKKGTILFSLRDKDRAPALPVAKALLDMGYSLLGTEGPARFFNEEGLSVQAVKKIAEGRPNVLDAIKNKEVTLVINTPDGKRARSDGFHIRRNALLYNVPIVTTLSSARAVVEGLQESRRSPWRIHSLQELHGLPGANGKH